MKPCSLSAQADESVDVRGYEMRKVIKTKVTGVCIVSDMKYKHNKHCLVVIIDCVFNYMFVLLEKQKDF